MLEERAKELVGSTTALLVGKVEWYVIDLGHVAEDVNTGGWFVPKLPRK